MTVVLAACGAKQPFSAGEGDVSGVWTATLPGTVFHGEDGTGQSTSLTLTMEQDGSRVAGSESFTDTAGRSGSSTVTGTFIGTTLAYAREDFDPACGGREVRSVATVTSVESGSTIMVGFGADPAGSCPMLSDSVEYRKR